MKKSPMVVKIGTFMLLMFLVACESKEKKMAEGFVLPKGDIAMGKVAFAEMNCHSCHSVSDEKFPELVETSNVRLHLGGEDRKVKSYGGLVTSIINPTHIVSKEYLKSFDKELRDGVETAMPSVNDQMTVEQMVNIVEFLNSKYEKFESDVKLPYLGPRYYDPRYHSL